jgi:hypothetical protein
LSLTSGYFIPSTPSATTSGLNLSGTALNVVVDGSTIKINGSNQLYGTVTQYTNAMAVSACNGTYVLLTATTQTITGALTITSQLGISDHISFAANAGYFTGTGFSLYPRASVPANAVLTVDYVQSGNASYPNLFGSSKFSSALLFDDGGGHTWNVTGVAISELTNVAQFNGYLDALGYNLHGLGFIAPNSGSVWFNGASSGVLPIVCGAVTMYNGTGYVQLISGASSAYSITFPTSVTSGLIKTDGSGNISFAGLANTDVAVNTIGLTKLAYASQRYSLIGSGSTPFAWSEITSTGDATKFLRNDLTWQTVTGLTAIANNTMLGNNSGGSAVPSALTPAQINTMLSTIPDTTLGAGMSDFQEIAPLGYSSQPVGTWGPTTTSSESRIIYNSSNGSADKISYLTSFSGGTYTFRIVFAKGTSYGKFLVYVDSTVIDGTGQDTYAGSATQNNLYTVTGVAITAGSHTISILVNGHNGSSSGYIIVIEDIIIWRTA